MLVQRAPSTESPHLVRHPADRPRMKQCDRSPTSVSVGSGSRQIEPMPAHLADASWRQAFETQSSSVSIARVEAYAASRARMIESASQRRDPLLARELVLDAVADTFTGVVKWDPNKAPLAAHLCRVIGGRSAHELARAKAYTMVSIDDTTSPVALAIEEETSNAMDAINENPEVTSASTGTAMEALRQLAAHDTDVLRLLEAFDDDVFERPDVLKVTGMSTVDYDNARRRLMRFARKL